MRLFVALWPPPDVLDDLTTHLEQVRHAVPGLRWSTREQWHLTLTFIADLDDGRLPELERRLARAASRHTGVTLQFAGAGRFGDRVLFTGIDGDRTALRRLAASTTAAARRTGVPVPDRPYRPHLTLARSRPGTDLRPHVDALDEYQGPRWTASALDLMASHLGAGPGGRAAYESVARWPLGRSDEDRPDRHQPH